MKVPQTKDITGEMILLGTGTSVGVPALGCDCEVCTGGMPRNQRTRCAAILGLPLGNLLIDTPPDLRIQLLREGIGIAHAVVYTHEHADHILGMDDLRLFQFYLGHGVPVYCEPHVQRHLKQTFAYAFTDIEQTHPGAVPAIDFHEIQAGETIELLGAEVTLLRLQHGPRFDVLGVRVGNVAYCTDTNNIPDESYPLLENLDVLILDALRYEPHATHFGLDEAVAVAQKIGAKQTYFTHGSCRLDYDTVNEQTPDGIEMAYDGLRIPLN